MDANERQKLEAAIAVMDARAARYRSMADDAVRMANELRRELGMNGAAKISAQQRHKGRKGGSLLDLAIEVIRENNNQAHMSVIHPGVADKAGREVSRASIEAALIRDMGASKPRVRRTAPGTYAPA